jgi:hypothetical protein
MVNTKKVAQCHKPRPAPAVLPGGHASSPVTAIHLGLHVTVSPSHYKVMMLAAHHSN